MARALSDSVDHESRKSRLAQYVADGMAVADAGRALGLSKGATSRAWSNIKVDLGAQAV